MSYDPLQAELAQHVPVVQCSIAGTRIVGRLCVGNKNGLLVPQTTTDQELLHLRNAVRRDWEMRRDLCGDTRVGMGVALWALLLCSWALLLGFAIGLCSWALQLGFAIGLWAQERIDTWEIVGRDMRQIWGRVRFSRFRFSLGEDTHYLKYLDMHLITHEDAGHV